MAWGEAFRLVDILLRDPSSEVAAALSGWKYSIDRTTMAVLDLYDRFVEANSDPKKPRPKPHSGRPFEFRNGGRRHGNAGGRTPRQVVEILNRFGHQIPV